MSTARPVSSSHLTTTNALINASAAFDTDEAGGKRKLSWGPQVPRSVFEAGAIVRKEEEALIRYLPPDDAIVRLWNLFCVKRCDAEQELRGAKASGNLTLSRRRTKTFSRSEWTDLVHGDSAGPEIHFGTVRRELFFRLCGSAAGTFDPQPAAASFIVRVCLFFFFFEVQSLGVRQNLGCDIVRGADQSTTVLARDRKRRRGGRGGGGKKRSGRSEIG